MEQFLLGSFVPHVIGPRKSGTPYQGAPHSRFDLTLCSFRRLRHRTAGEVVSAAIRAVVQPQRLPRYCLSSYNRDLGRLLAEVAVLSEAHANLELVTSK